MDLKKKNPIHRILSIVLVMALIIEFFPQTMVFADSPYELYGGSISYKGVTARVVSETTEGTMHTLRLSGERGEENPAYLDGFCYLLYSPKERRFARESNGSPASCELSDWDDTGEYRGTIEYREETGNSGGQISDWELFCLYLDAPSLGGIRASFSESDLSAILLGELPVNIRGTEELSGVHAFFPTGSFAASSGRETITTGGGGNEYHSDPLSVSFTLPDMTERAYDIRLLHTFWGDNGSLKVHGAGNGDRYFGTACDKDGRLIEIKELTETESDDTTPVSYLGTEIERYKQASGIKLIGLDRNFAPLTYDLTKPEAAVIEEAQVGEPGEKGSASVSIAGTGSEGNVVLKKASKPVPYDNTKTIAMVDASMDDGELSGVAEIRIKYQSDDVNGKTCSPSELLPGYYNEETGEWETPVYYIDEETHEVVILADHFSTYGLFEI